MLIKDLSRELDTEAQAAVVGGNNGNAATNSIGQQQVINVPVAIMAGGPSNNNVSVTGTQTACLDNTQFAGDSFLALLPFPLARGL